jgi:succinate-semialdehyde dehydrogenase/glutarate-semialdehyde dehydrogenase
MSVGAGTEPGVMIGPLIDLAALEKVQSHIEDALAGGAQILLGGKPHQRGGLFFEPTILTNVTQSMLVAREETFGPVAPLFRFHTDEEAIAMANASEFGLAAYFYARDIGRVLRVAGAIEAGMVCVNSGMLSNEVAPFGGIKLSGIGREGAKEGLEEYLEIKYLTLAGM